MTKSEFYGDFIRLHKKTGQGLGKILATLAKGIDGELVRVYLDELVEEGLVSCHSDGTSIGHPDAAKWYVPTSGYNVWTDNDHGSSYAGGNLDLVRYYLGALSHDEEPEGRENNAKYLNPSAQLLTQHPGFMMRYAKWLEKNHEDLEELKKLSDIYPGGESNLDDVGIEFMKSRGWFKNNLTVSECIDKSRKANDTDELIIRETTRLISLMENGSGYDKEIKKRKDEIEKIKSELDVRKRVISYMLRFDQNLTIKEASGLVD